jgi:hypothetical protein
MRPAVLLLLAVSWLSPSGLAFRIGQQWLQHRTATSWRIGRISTRQSGRPRPEVVMKSAPALPTDEAKPEKGVDIMEELVEVEKVVQQRLEVGEPVDHC